MARGLVASEEGLQMRCFANYETHRLGFWAAVLVPALLGLFLFAPLADAKESGIICRGGDIQVTISHAFSGMMTRTHQYNFTEVSYLGRVLNSSSIYWTGQSSCSFGISRVNVGVVGFLCKRNNESLEFADIAPQFALEGELLIREEYDGSISDVQNTGNMQLLGFAKGNTRTLLARLHCVLN
jgi:hypothetical protein